MRRWRRQPPAVPPPPEHVHRYASRALLAGAIAAGTGSHVDENGKAWDTWAHCLDCGAQFLMTPPEGIRFPDAA